MVTKILGACYYLIGSILFRRSSLFDAQWYELAYPVRTKRNSIHHYLTKGAALGYNPSRFFDSQAYQKRYLANSPSSPVPLLHYLLIGRWRGFQKQAAEPSDADIIRDSGFFNDDWYYAAYPDVLASRIPALRHFMTFGWRENRSPGPEFNSTWYLNRYPHVIGQNPLLHFIKHGRGEGYLATPPTVDLDSARKVIEEVEDLDPEIYAANYGQDIANLEISTSMPRHRIALVFEKIISRLNKPPKIIVFVPWLKRGGADLLACHVARACVETFGLHSILVVLTDNDDRSGEHRLPDGVNVVSFSAIAPDLDESARVELVEALVRSLQPSAIINVNSRQCWEAIRRHGHRMVQFAQLYAMLFCPDYDSQGRRFGYSYEFLRPCLQFLAGVYFDNTTHLEDLKEQFAIPPDLQDRLVCLLQPAPPLIPPRLREDGDTRRPNILWAGRITRQKNIRLLLEILQNARQFDFHIWGDTDDPTLMAALDDVARSRDYVFLNGKFDRFEDLPLPSYDVFLYTSLWDGLPNVLLEAAASGLPIVASESGGIAELVNDTTGWLVPPSHQAPGFIAALREATDNPETAYLRATAMQRRLIEHHNWKSYKTVLTQQPSATGGLLNG